MEGTVGTGAEVLVPMNVGGGDTRVEPFPEEEI